MRKKRIAEAALAAAEAHELGNAMDFTGFRGGKIPQGIAIPVDRVTERELKRFLDHLMNEMPGEDQKPHQIPSVNRILVSGNATIVFWADDTKTVVRCAKGETPDLYAAFTAALGIKLYGSNSQLKKIIDRNTVIQKPKKVKKPADPEPMTAAEDVLASGV